MRKYFCDHCEREVPQLDMKYNALLSMEVCPNCNSIFKRLEAIAIEKRRKESAFISKHKEDFMRLLNMTTPNRLEQVFGQEGMALYVKLMRELESEKTEELEKEKENKDAGKSSNGNSGKISETGKTG